jgi:hypothetical protein
MNGLDDTAEDELDPEVPAPAKKLLDRTAADATDDY